MRTYRLQGRTRPNELKDDLMHVFLHLRVTWCLGGWVGTKIKTIMIIIMIIMILINLDNNNDYNDDNEYNDFDKA